MYYAIDVILLAIIVILTIRGQRKGFVRMLIETIGYIASLVAAYFVSHRFGHVLYNSYFKAGVLRSIEGRMMGSDSLDSATVAFNSIPDQLRGIASKLGFDTVEISGRIASSNTSKDVASVLEETVVGPIVIILCKFVLFIAAMALAAIVLKFIIGIIGRLVEFPVIKTANGGLGAVFGFINGIIVALIVSAIIFVVAGAIDNENVADKITSTYVMQFISNIATKFAGYLG